MKHTLKSLSKEIAVGVILIVIFSNIISYLRKPQLDRQTLPELSVKLIDGSHYLLPKGKPVVIHFWATWCPVCKMESANIEHLSANYELLTIAVNSGDTEKLRRYMREKGMTFRVLNDRDGVWAQRFKVEVFPTTFIYGSDGQLKFTEVGYTTTAGLTARAALAN